MNRDYEEHLSIFCEQGTEAEIIPYFEKYWLHRSTGAEKWFPIQNSIFDNNAKFLPDIMFNKGFDLLPLVGGNIFVSEEDFALVQECARSVGDKEFAIVQNEKVVTEVYYGENDYRVLPALRFHYPIDISWKELMSAGMLSMALFQDGSNEFFVFGDSGYWGRYVASSYTQPSNLIGQNPLNIMGFKKEYAEVFRKFERLQRSEPEITPDILYSEWLPSSYLEKCRPG
jgi:hypothetical protein